MRIMHIMHTVIKIVIISIIVSHYHTNSYGFCILMSHYHTNSYVFLHHCVTLAYEFIWFRNHYVTF